MYIITWYLPLIWNWFEEEKLVWNLSQQKQMKDKNVIATKQVPTVCEISKFLSS